MPCRVPKRRFSCGAPQHLTKNQSFFFLRKGPGFYYFRGTFPRVLMTNLPSLLRLFGPFALAQQRRSRRSFYFPVAA